MIQKDSGVFFVDILGFSALTKGLIKDITEQDYKAWGLMPCEFNSSFLSAKIILEFRAVLKQLKNKYPAINIGQLSDCAFIWTDDIILLIQAVHFVMWSMIGQKGILCRGGLSYGDIVEIDNVDYNLGAFIVGSAVTNAVKNEGMLKGPRVAMDLSITDEIQRNFNKYSSAMLMAYDLFHNIESMIDMNQVDEYRWYLCDDEMIAIKPIGMLDIQTRYALTKQRLKLVDVLRFHPRMGWNCRSTEGLVQLKAGIKSLSENGLLQVLHYFEYNDVHKLPRNNSQLASADARIDTELYYSASQYNEWKEHLEDID